jgi:signal transduction histidine kinase
MARRTPYAGKRASAGRDRQAPAGSRGPSATQPVASAAGTLPADFDPPGNGHQPLPEAEPGPGPGSRRALKNWRVRSRLFLLVAIPTVTAMILGGIRIASSVQSAVANQRVMRMVNLNGQITGLVQALQKERQDTVTFITLGSNGGRAAALSSRSANAQLELKVLDHGDYAASSQLAGQVRNLLGTIGTGYSELAQQDASAAMAAINGLGALRTAAARSQLPALDVIQKYNDKINTLLALDDQVAVGSGDSILAGEVRVVGLVSAMKEESSEQQALITAAQSSSLIGLSPTGLTSGLQDAITESETEQQSNEAQFNAAATAGQRQLLDGTLSAPTVAGARAQVQQAISLAQTASSGAEDPAIANASTSLDSVVSGMRLVEMQLVKSMITRSTTLRNSAITGVIIWSSIVLLVLALALVSIAVVGRSMVRPLRRLRTGALDVAGLRLPQTVRQMSESDGAAVSLDVEPIDVDSLDEIGEVARAFDQVHREAIRLAANEAALRGNVNSMFVNLSRRSQSLVERLIRLIDDLEQGEQDSKRLSSLFQMDHLATRLRRNSENLLVLAGQDISRRWNRPVPLVDVLRAALSEIERYERVTLNVQQGIAVRAHAVSDVVHLTAELVENATSFSAADSPVTVAGHLLSSGGVLLEITDRGVGMGADEMAHVNWRLDNPPVVDVAVSRRMGLFVVGRLAARHGIRVRVRPEESGGLVALVWLPDEAITRENPGSPSGMPRPRAVTPKDLVAGEAGSTVAEQEITAARVPRFASLRANSDVAGPVLRRDAAGVAPPPVDASAATGPLPSFRAAHPPAAEFEAGVAEPQVGDPAFVNRDERHGTAPAAETDDLAEDQADQRYGASHTDAPSYGWRTGLSPSGVMVPPAESQAEQNRLPIFEAVESDWFRRGLQTLSRSSQDAEAGSGWASPADEGWRAAEVVSDPSSSGLTSAGLPKRVPRANLIPGAAPHSAAAETAPAVTSIRSAAVTRDRFARFQRGVRQGRAAASGIESDGGGDETSG